jgi:hypothetical protein
MTTRFWWTLALAIGLTGCTGVGTETTDPKDNPGDDDDDVVNTTPTGDTATNTGTDGYFNVGVFLIQANFGFNVDTGIVDVVTPQGASISSILLILGSDRWVDDGYSFDSDQYCLVQLPLFNGVDPTWVSANALWYGVDYDPTAGAGTDCIDDHALDPAQWGYEPGFIFADYYSWGAGVGPLNEEYTYTASDPLLPYLHGGWIENEFLPPPEGQQGYRSLANETDAQNNVLYDAQNEVIRILADEVPVAGAPAPLAQGQYVVTSRWIWTITFGS